MTGGIKPSYRGDRSTDLGQEGRPTVQREPSDRDLEVLRRVFNFKPTTPSKVKIQADPTKEGSAASDVARRVLEDKLENFDVGPQPRVRPEDYSEGFRPLLEPDLANRLMSLLACSHWGEKFKAITVRDIDKTVAMINELAEASDEEMAPEKRAFVISELLAHVLAYRKVSHYESVRDKIKIKLPVRVGDTFAFKECRFDREIDLLGGITATAFVPVDGRGTPLILIHGTLVWAGADGAGVTFADDFNPLGPATLIVAVAKGRLESILTDYRTKYQQGAILLGHSLGGILSTRLTVELPHLVEKALSFNAARQTFQAAKKWESLTAFKDKVDRLHWKNALETLNSLDVSGKGSVDEMVKLLMKRAEQDVSLKSTAERNKFQDQLKAIVLEWRDLHSHYGWSKVPSKMPEIDTFASVYHGQNDVITDLGDAWIGRVHKLSVDDSANGIDRHEKLIGLSKKVKISPVNTQKANQSWLRRTVLWLGQRIGATIVACIVYPLLGAKRFLFGWSTGGVWRYGLLGWPFVWVWRFGKFVLGAS